MRRTMMSAVAFFVVVSLQGVALSQESTKAEFKEYCDAMEGRWRSNLTLAHDLPGIGEKGDKLTVRSVNTVAPGGSAVVGSGSDGKGGANSLTFYDAQKKQIRGVVVFSGGTVVSVVVSKQESGKWLSVGIAVDPDGTKAERKSTLVISDEGNTHTWTQDGISNVWRRARKKGAE